MSEKDKPPHNVIYLADKPKWLNRRGSKQDIESNEHPQTPDVGQILKLEKKTGCPCGLCALRKKGLASLKVTAKIDEIERRLPEYSSEEISPQIKNDLSQKTLLELAEKILGLLPDESKKQYLTDSPAYCQKLFAEYNKKKEQAARIHVNFLKEQKE